MNTARMSAILRVAPRTAPKALALGAALLLAAGCTYNQNPDIDAAIKRQQCNTVVFGGILEYLVRQGICAATRPEPTVETVADRWQDMCRDAAAGNGPARSALAWHYRNGWTPARQDRVEAYKWFALAVDAGFAEAADYRDELGAELTPDQMTEADTRLAAWSPEAETCAAGPGNASAGMRVRE